MKSCPTCQANYPVGYAVCPQDGTPLVEVTAWSPGTMIRGKYRILSKVGEGGMGAVYKALHVAFDELRALKVISRGLMADELFVKRFKHEAIITRRLQHPNAVRVDDIDEAEDGRPFIVMEFIEGQSLKKLIQERGALPVQRTCAIVKQVAAALDAAHRLSMIHRDIKPDNIVLVDAPEGERAKVLDFGIAKIKEGRLGDTGAAMTLTGTGVVIGTPQYMSPEQAMGKRGDQLDSRSDLYSLGVVMYQMLTGDLPFKADTTMEMLLAHLQKPPTPICVLRPELHIPDVVADVVMKTLEKDRERRPATGAEFIGDLERALGEIPVPGETRVIRPTVVLASQAPSPMPEVAGRPSPAPIVQEAEVREQEPLRAPGPLPHSASPPARPEARLATAEQPPVVAPVPVRREMRHGPSVAKPARWGLWASVAILVLGFGGGVWYFQSRPPAESLPVAGSEHAVPEEQASPAPETDLTGREPSRRESPTQRTSTPSPGPSLTRPQEASVSPLASQPATQTPTRAAAPAVDTRAISAALSLGKFYFDRGEYDKAIAEYEKGLRLDPSNRQIQEALQRTKTAKEAEERILR